MQNGPISFSDLAGVRFVRMPEGSLAKYETRERKTVYLTEYSVCRNAPSELAGAQLLNLLTAFKAATDSTKLTVYFRSENNKIFNTHLREDNSIYSSGSISVVGTTDKGLVCTIDELYFSDDYLRTFTVEVIENALGGLTAANNCWCSSSEAVEGREYLVGWKGSPEVELASFNKRNGWTATNANGRLPFLSPPTHICEIKGP